VLPEQLLGELPLGDAQVRQVQIRLGESRVLMELLDDRRPPRLLQLVSLEQGGGELPRRELANLGQPGLQLLRGLG
jgi:hypothetical protein